MAADWRYHAAEEGWILLCRQDLLLAVEPAFGTERLEALWPIVGGGSGSTVIIDELTRGGVSSTPGFVLAESVDGSWRTLVRGSARVEFAGEAPIDGRGSLAWSEKRVPVETPVRIRLGAPVADADVPAWPLRAGVVRADVVDIGPPVPTQAASHDPLPEIVKSAAAPVAAAPVPPASVAVTPGAELSEQTLVSQTVSAPISPAEESEEVGVYDHLFGETVIRRVEEAAIRDDSVDAVVEVALEDRTKVATDLAARRALRRAAKLAAESEQPTSGHWLELSTGGREALDGVVIVGRAPVASRIAGADVPRLITMSTPNQDISRTHAKIALEGGTVVVTDLHSSNGTFVVLPGRAPQKLRAGEPTPVVVGTLIDLGDGATLTVREEK